MPLATSACSNLIGYVQSNNIGGYSGLADAEWEPFVFTCELHQDSPCALIIHISAFVIGIFQRRKPVFTEERFKNRICSLRRRCGIVPPQSIRPEIKRQDHPVTPSPLVLLSFFQCRILLHEKIWHSANVVADSQLGVEYHPCPLLVQKRINLYPLPFSSHEGLVQNTERAFSYSIPILHCHLIHPHS